MRRGARAMLVALVTALGATLASCTSDGLFGLNESSTFTTGTALHTITVGSLERSYVLTVPSRRPTSTNGTVMPYPLLVLLHGSSSNGEDMREMTHMDSIGEALHWVVAYPNGQRGSGGLFPTDWNAGTCCGAAGREHIDDVGFIAALMDEVAGELPIDKRRVYVAGFSDGGRMAHHLGCTLAGRIAAIGVVSGSMKDDSCVPSRGIGVVAIHGLDDDIVPFDEASETPPPAGVSSDAALLPESLQFWAATNGCQTAAVSQYAAHVARTAFLKCAKADMIFYAVSGGTHTWPLATLPPTDDPDTELSATALLAQFFLRQAR